MLTGDFPQRIQRIIQVVNFSLAAEVDLAEAVTLKIDEIEAKYPVEKARGRSTKHTDL